MISRFDAWNASFRPDFLRAARDLLRDNLGAEFERRNSGIHGYRCAEYVNIGGARHGLIAWGGISRPFVEIKGEPAQRWYELLQPYILADIAAAPPEPLAQLTRADVCYDWQSADDVRALAPGLIDAVTAGPGRAVQWTQAGDWLTEEGRLRGCTLYAGARCSPVMMRLYDKGLERIAAGDDAPPDLRRLEIVVKPRGGARCSWVTMPPAAFWDASAASRTAADYFGISRTAGAPLSYPVQSDIDRQIMFASVQYGAAIVELVRRATDSAQIVALVEDAIQINKDQHEHLEQRKRAAA